MAEKKLVINRKDIARRIKELGAAITRDYGEDRLLLIGILNGAFIFMADLVREIKLEIEIDFVRLASYGRGTTPSTHRFTKDIELDVHGKNLLVVEDIIDTGRTLALLKQSLESRGARSVRFCVLIDKQERRETEFTVDYTGFKIESGFLVGYGLDCSELYRQYPEIYSINDI
jgi:hypoxanthine phosphoribosyltransferase